MRWLQRRARVEVRKLQGELANSTGSLDSEASQKKLYLDSVVARRTGASVACSMQPCSTPQCRRVLTVWLAAA